MNSKERVLQFIDYKGFSNRDFCKKILVSSSYFTKLGAIGSNVMEKIAQEFPQINIDWVITGRGKMMLDPVSNYSFEVEKLSVVNEEAEVYKIAKDELIDALKNTITDKENIIKLLNEKLERLEKKYQTA